MLTVTTTAILLAVAMGAPPIYSAFVLLLVGLAYGVANPQSWRPGLARLARFAPER